MPRIIVRDLTRDRVLAQASEGEGDVVLLEGCYYFEPQQVAMDHLVITERTYTCPYKGVCHWIDLQTPEGSVPNVAWVYGDPRPGYDAIRGKIGFAFGMRPGVAVLKE